MDIITGNMTADRFWHLLSKKISSEASEPEIKELEQILSAHPEWRNTAETLSIFENQVIPPDDNDEGEKAFEKHIERVRKSDLSFEQLFANPDSELEFPREKGTTKRWGLPVLMVALAGLMLFILKNNIVSSSNTVKQQATQSQVTTKPGSRTQLRLPDGSTVWLNASSNLTYEENFGKKFREVNLTGEAFFDVAKDPSHPFIIHTGVIDVKVLGTAFNIKSYPNDANTETSVIRGKVEVTVKNRENTKYYLTPNEKVIVANNFFNGSNIDVQKTGAIKPTISIQPLTYYHVDSSIIETSWIENKLVFQENETFKEVALKMERWYGVHISFADPEVGEYRVFGSFTDETIKQALDALKMGFNFDYKIIKDEIIITK